MDSTIIADFVPLLDTNIYASGDVLSEAAALPNAVRQIGTGVLQSLQVIDGDDQGAAFSIYIFDQQVTMGPFNAAPAITDADAKHLLGRIDIATGDYKDLGGVKVATAAFQPFVLKPADVAASKSLWVALVNGTGTPTYTASGLTLRFGILQD